MLLLSTASTDQLPSCHSGSFDLQVAALREKPPLLCGATSAATMDGADHHEPHICNGRAVAAMAVAVCSTSSSDSSPWYGGKGKMEKMRFRVFFFLFFLL